MAQLINQLLLFQFYICVHSRPFAIKILFKVLYRHADGFAVHDIQRLNFFHRGGEVFLHRLMGQKHHRHLLTNVLLLLHHRTNTDVVFAEHMRDLRNDVRLILQRQAQICNSLF